MVLGSGTSHSAPLYSRVPDDYGSRPRFAEKNLNRVLGAAAWFLFPSRCLACDSRPLDRFFRGGVCEGCWAGLPQPPGARCATCDEPLPAAQAEECGRCLFDPPAFRALRAAAPYRDPARAILLAFKFGGADYLAPRLAAVMQERIPRATDGAPDEVAAVPATARARRKRDHAAELLGAALAARLSAPFARGRLQKIRPTERQSGLPQARRAENVRGAFRVRGAPAGRVLLVDDIATSGATARECARVLLGAGARSVDVWCFARASRDDLVLEDLQRQGRPESEVSR